MGALTQPELGKRLRQARARARLSLRALAEVVGVSFNTLSRVERGRPTSPRSHGRIVAWLDSQNHP